MAHIARGRVAGFSRGTRFADEIAHAEKDVKATRVRPARSAKRRKLKSSDVETAIADVRKRKGASHVRPE